MPLYEYECAACGRRFELIRKFADPPLDKCPTCGGSVHKLVSSPAFQFKGTGWYITDYAKKDQSGSSSESKSDGATDKSKAEKATEKTEKTEKVEKAEKSESKAETKISAGGDTAPAAGKSGA